MGARLIRNHILGGAWACPSTGSAAAATSTARPREMDEPTFKLLAMRQSRWKHMLESMGRYVLLKKAAADGVEAGLVEARVEGAGVFPELVSAPTSRSTRRRCSRSWSAARSRSTRA
jgi:hypothetical protein